MPVARRPFLPVLLALWFAPDASAKDLTACDTAILAKHWEIPKEEVRAMADLADARGDSVEAILEKRKRAITPTGFAVCAYDDYGYSYNDAEILAKHWNMDVSEVKATIERKLILGDDSMVRGQLAMARKPSPMDTPRDYNTCDAELIAMLTGAGLSSAKADIQRRVSAGERASVETKLAAARERLPPEGGSDLCAFHTLPYTYADAEAIANAWGTSVMDAKAAIEQKARDGYLPMIDARLRELRGGR